MPPPLPNPLWPIQETITQTYLLTDYIKEIHEVTTTITSTFTLLSNNAGLVPATLTRIVPKLAWTNAVEALTVTRTAVAVQAIGAGGATATAKMDMPTATSSIFAVWDELLHKYIESQPTATTSAIAESTPPPAAACLGSWTIMCDDESFWHFFTSLKWVGYLLWGSAGFACFLLALSLITMVIVAFAMACGFDPDEEMMRIERINQEAKEERERASEARRERGRETERVREREGAIVAEASQYEMVAMEEGGSPQGGTNPEAEEEGGYEEELVKEAMGGEAAVQVQSTEGSRSKEEETNGETVWDWEVEADKANETSGTDENV
jgi:hypothetical protein